MDLKKGGGVWNALGNEFGEVIKPIMTWKEVPVLAPKLEYIQI